MTLKEAIKSGRPFKRKSDPRWILWGRPKSDYLFTVDEVTADDWELKPPMMEVKVDPTLKEDEFRLEVGDHTSYIHKLDSPDPDGCTHCCSKGPFCYMAGRIIDGYFVPSSKYEGAILRNIKEWEK